MRTLVTGAAGFTGGHLARALRAGGHEVRALVRAADARAAALARDGIDVATGDLRDPGALGRAVDGVEVVSLVSRELDKTR
ncbi:MAG TPA: NmrA family NAD(P)-binding protein, partial [Vicinamibacterales bacterium]|nr:NmrA family NAD(P)-binding protein [Vicinamibacterales bacterium]